MRPRTRRAVLATAGTALLAGCGSSDRDDPDAAGTRSDASGRSSTPTPTPTRTPSPTGRSTDAAEPTVGPEPLGRAAVPEDAPSPPAFARERVYDAEAGRDAAAVAGTADDLSVLLYAPTGNGGGDGDGPGPPVLVEVDGDGRARSRATLADLPTNRAYLLERVDDLHVVGGLDRRGDARTAWLHGRRAGERAFEHRAPNATYAALATTGGPGAGTDGGSGAGTRTGTGAGDGTRLLVAGTIRPSGADGASRGLLARLRPDGSLERRLVADESVGDTRYWAVTPTATPPGTLVGGARANDVSLVAVDADGEIRWRRTIPRGREEYVVEGLAVGSTGTYVAAGTVQFATGDDHVLLLSLSGDGDGAVEWTRVFDPNHGDVDAPRDLRLAGVVDDGGPVLAGSTRRRTWLAALDPDGAVRWAGYRGHGSTPTTAVGLRSVGGRPVVHGRVGTPPESDGTRLRPWLAWL